MTKSEENAVHAAPHDGTLEHVWFFEPTPGKHHEVLAPSGVENIAAHKYVPGRCTHLDNFCNPAWNRLTTLLPMWLAPNMVTTFGGLHCGLSYFVLWYFSPNFDTDVPDWTILLAGYCTLAYYTLDCMDGKQARRTGSSSPLGQLFDHGFDCICNMAHVAAAGGYTMCGGTKWFFLLQFLFQFSFFVAQWEEYYTRVLPHSTSDWFGVTEGVYGLGLLTAVMAFIDRKAFWMATVGSFLPASLSNLTPTALSEMELRYAYVVGWAITGFFLVFFSIVRVMKHERTKQLKFSAITKLLSPLLVGLSPFLLPGKYIQNNTRYVSVATGLLFSIITKKMIVFSMAKMSYASVQLDVLPFVMGCLWIRYDARLTEKGAFLVMVILSLAYAIRLVFWARRAITDICRRLGIWCFRIKPKKEKFN